MLYTRALDCPHITMSLRCFSGNICIIHLHCVQGAVMVTLKKGEDLPSADPNGYSDPYVKFKLHDKSKKSTIKRFTLNPAWNEKFEWFKVRSSMAVSGLA